ncbi:low temperature requirement protein A [Streptomyces althioticus]|uniref:low temperature requirement protein A n=1 Tax=Streptomyces althioticus TaxID=83380 RepID=UPI003674B9C7
MTHASHTSSARHRPMVARHSGEQHRTSSALELFFDLCFVVAIAQAASALEHEIVAGHATRGLLGYALVFFAIWWAWMNFTWFASAFDTDDVPYRLLTLIQITGALIMAAGITTAMHEDFTIVTGGYVVMRLAMVSQWLRAAHSDKEHRPAALRYASGILVLQVGWLVRLALPHEGGILSFVVLGLGELAVPFWAERAVGTTWHPHHIAERYGLFTLIVLGESITAAALAVRTALDSDTAVAPVLIISLGGLLTVFALWWLYFAQDAPRRLAAQTTAMLWGYGHYVVFGAAAAVGVGIAVNVAHLTDHGALTDVQASATYTVPVAVFISCVWLLHRRATRLPAAVNVLAPLAVLAVLATTFTACAVLGTGIVASLLIGAHSLRTGGRQ